MWKLKNSDEYAVFATSKSNAVKAFKKNLGMIVKKYQIEKIN